VMCIHDGALDQSGAASSMNSVPGEHLAKTLNNWRVDIIVG
jgi:hypothetical protein